MNKMDFRKREDLWIKDPATSFLKKKKNYSIQKLPITLKTLIKQIILGIKSIPIYQNYV